MLLHDGRRVDARIEVNCASIDTACPACGVNPLRARGRRMHIASDDRAYESNASCVDCDADVGTLFGLREDESVLTHGLARVYVAGGES